MINKCGKTVHFWEMENFSYPVSRIGCDDKIMQTRRQLDEVTILSNKGRSIALEKLKGQRFIEQNNVEIAFRSFVSFLETDFFKNGIDAPAKVGKDVLNIMVLTLSEKVMDMMRSNIEKLSERSERLEDLASRAQVLDMSSQEFQRCAGEVRRKKMWKAYATKVVALSIVGITVISTIGYFAI